MNSRSHVKTLVERLSLQVSLLNTRWRQATMICFDVDSRLSEILLSIYWIYFEVVSILGLKCILFFSVNLHPPEKDGLIRDEKKTLKAD